MDFLRAEIVLTFCCVAVADSVFLAQLTQGSICLFSDQTIIG